MGLIKTAILTGGGVYAVNKIAKSAERAHASSPNNTGYPPQQRSQYQQPQNPQNQFSNRGYQGDERGGIPASSSSNNNQYPPQGYWAPPPPQNSYQQPQYMQTQHGNGSPEVFERRQLPPSGTPPPYDMASQQRGGVGGDLMGRAMEVLETHGKDGKLSKVFKQMQL
ncbi:hypothetical protein BP5796_12230 [Coleophoma crateriformis]|uniref:Uncharacterized protein n=1 Tax=Coleophoma crateriformis TaxID=565419 RepID=A0A3D8Q9G2_9HELO|nr:hypothetical protein BP5796_12230 [Coleophoma crateriformis]